VRGSLQILLVQCLARQRCGGKILIFVSGFQYIFVDIHSESIVVVSINVILFSEMFMGKYNRCVDTIGK